MRSPPCPSSYSSPEENKREHICWLVRCLLNRWLPTAPAVGAEGDRPTGVLPLDEQRAGDGWLQPALLAVCTPSFAQDLPTLTWSLGGGGGRPIS